MQFKTLAFLSILSILLFTGCDSKDNNESASLYLDFLEKEFMQKLLIYIRKFSFVIPQETFIT